MAELLALYATTMAAAVVLAVALALIGSQMAARNQSVQVLVVSQGASLGVILGLALTHLQSGHHEESAIFPYLIGAGLGGMLYLLCDRAIRPYRPSRNTFYIAWFAALLALAYVVTALAPALESHMVLSFFGDLAMMSEIEATTSVIVGLVACAWLLVRWRQVSWWSFDLAIFGRRGVEDRRTEAMFLALSLLILTWSIQVAGFLFTVAALFLPAVLLARWPLTLWRYAIGLVLLAVTTVAAGLVFSLAHGQLPTVPTVVLAMVVVGAPLSFVLAYLLLRGEMR